MERDTSRIAVIESQLGSKIVVERQLAGGWNNGALLVRVDDHARVLKFHQQRNLGELQSIRQVCELGLGNGWPTPRWMESGSISSDVVWSIQEFVEGVNPHVLTEADARAIIVANARQAGLGRRFPASASLLVDRTAVIESMIVHDQWGHLQRLSAFSASARRLVEVLCAEATPIPTLSNEDLVHGDYNQENILMANGKVAAFIDTDEIGRGTRYFDLVDLFHRSYQKFDPPAACVLLRETVVDALGSKAFAACLATTAIGSMNWMIERMPERLPARISRLLALFHDAD